MTLEEAVGQVNPADHIVALEVAEEAGRLLLELRATMAPASDPQHLRDEGDRRSHELIIRRLAALRPGDAVLSEEGNDDARRLESRRVWIVDPLDGTREYGEPPRCDWAVHVALCVDGAPVVGTVALPAEGLALSTSGSLPVIAPWSGQLRLAVSRTRAPALATHLAAALGGRLVPMGSAGAKAMAVLKGDVDVYVHAGGQFEWDSAAPAAVAMAAGLHASRIDGSPLVYNRAHPYMPDLLICRPELSETLLELLSGFDRSVAV